MNKLDVGCGLRPSGTINCDYTRNMIQTLNKSDRGKLISLDVVCDAHHLPFKSKSFNEVYSSHTIEHLKSPAQFIKEAERVAVSKVTIKCPTRWHIRGHTFHLWTLSRRWFAHLGYSTDVVLSPLVHLKFSPFQFCVSSEIIATKSL